MDLLQVYGGDWTTLQALVGQSSLRRCTVEGSVALAVAFVLSEMCKSRVQYACRQQIMVLRRNVLGLTVAIHRQSGFALALTGCPLLTLLTCTASKREEEQTLALEHRPLLVEYLLNLESLLSHLDKVHISPSPLLEAKVHNSRRVQLQERLEC